MEKLEEKVKWYQYPVSEKILKVLAVPLTFFGAYLGLIGLDSLNRPEEKEPKKEYYMGAPFIGVVKGPNGISEMYLQDFDGDNWVDFIHNGLANCWIAKGYESEVGSYTAKHARIMTEAIRARSSVIFQDQKYLCYLMAKEEFEKKKKKE